MAAEKSVQGNFGRNAKKTAAPIVPVNAPVSTAPTKPSVLKGASSGTPSTTYSSAKLVYPDSKTNITKGAGNTSTYTDPKTGKQTILQNPSSGDMTVGFPPGVSDPNKPITGSPNLGPTGRTGGVNGLSTSMQTATETAPSTPSAPGSNNPSSPGNPTAPAQPQMVNPLEQTQTQADQQAAQQGGFREGAVNSVGEEFFKSTGAHAQYIKDQIAAYEKKTGTEVAFNSRAFQSQLKQSLGNQNKWDPIFKRFAHKTEFSTTVDPATSSADQTQASINQPLVEPEQTIEDKVSTILNDQGSQTLHSQLEQLLTMEPGTPGETMLRNVLMLQLGAIDDPEINKYLDAQESRALQKYREGMAMIDVGEAEINKAIDGTLTTPTTSEGLMAKIAYQGEQMQLESIESEKSYQQSRSDLLLGDMRSKRADLEGYTKAKLYSMGAENSSAGIALLGKIVSEADMQITLASLDANHAQTQLNSQSRMVMADFTNTVSKLVLDNKARESELGETYDNTITKVEDNRFTNEREKRKETLDLYAGYIKDVNTLREKQKADERQALNDAYERMSDLRDQAYKISGLMGTVYVPGEDGQLVDTGVPTFDAKKFETTSMQDMMRLDLDYKGENRQMAKSLIDTYGSAAAPYVEKLMGLPSGALSGFQTNDEMNRALDYMKESNDMTKFRIQEGLDGENGEIISKTTPGQIKSGGIGIDPFSLPDVRANIKNMSSITQSFSKPGSGKGTDPSGGHGGMDYVSKDGYTRAVRGGTVIKITPWNGNSAFGNQVIIQDQAGLMWQYSHLGNRNIQGDNPFSVQVGDEVHPGDVLGREGNTGRIITSKTGANAGRHTDLRVVGYTPPENPPEQEDFQIGKISGKYESGNDYGRVSSGAGDPGGKSYGSHQFASKMGSLTAFLSESGYGKAFAGKPVGSAQFDQKWKELAKDPAFGKAQDQYIAKHYYYPHLETLKKRGIDLSNHGPAVQEAIYSTSVQYGPNTDVISTALKGKNVANMSDEEVVIAIQDAKAARVGSIAPGVRAGVANRIKAEKQDLINLARQADLSTPINFSMPSDKDLFDAYQEKTGKAPTQDVRRALRQGGWDALEEMTMTDDERDQIRDESEVIDSSNNWLADKAPGMKDAPNFGDIFTDRGFTYKEIVDDYVKEFKEMPSASDEKLLRQYGLKGLKMIREREASKKKKSDIISVT